MDTKRFRLHQRYEIEKVIHEGALRTLYRAIDRKTGKRVVIKQGLVSKEIEMMQALSKVRGIVPLLDFFSEEEQTYYVMPFLSGGTLRDFREKKRGPLLEDEVLDLLKSMIESIKEMHCFGILHRDISPDNLVFDEEGSLWLIDFGATRRLVDQTIPESVQIRHGYAPPEQYSLQKEQGAWTDIYALCAVIYYMITGADPISATDRMGGAYLIPLNKLGMSSKTFSECIQKGLELEIENRFQKIEEMIQSFGEKK